MASIRKRTWVTASDEKRSAWTVDFVDTSGRRERKQFSTKREADAFRVEIEGQLRAGTFRPDASKVTVEEVADLFLNYCEGRMTRGEHMTRHNLKVYEGHIKNYICPDSTRHSEDKRPVRLTKFTKGMNQLKIGQVTAGRVIDFRDDLRNAGVSVPTTRKILSTLSLVFKYAKGRDLLAINTAEDVEVIGRRDEGAKKIVPPSKEVLKALVNSATSDFKLRLIVASATGLRAGEFHALRWRHIDFSAGELTVETRVDVYGEEDVTKTAAGMRTIPLGASVISLLKQWKLRSRWSKPDDLVFPNLRGRYTSHDDMVKRKFLPLFDKLEQQYELDPESNPKPERFNWHALRHFAISCWIEAGLSPKTVQTFAGHSSLQVTMDRYGHLFKSDDHKEAMDQIAKGLFA